MQRTLAIPAALGLALAVAGGGCSGCEGSGEDAARAPSAPPAAREPAPAPGEAPPGQAGGPERAPAVLVRRLSPEAPGAQPGREALRIPRPVEVDPRLEDPDPERRIEALEDLEPEGEALHQIEQLLRRDPDPLVRVAAAEQLETSESGEAVQSLLDALSDPDPRVVIAALEALEFVADERVVPQIDRWRNHPDPEVREAVEDAIEFLE